MEIKNSLEKFSWHFKNALKTATAAAAELGQQKAEPAHLLYGLLLEHGSIAGEYLRGLKLDADLLRSYLQTHFSGTLTDAPLPSDLSADSKKIIERAALLAWQNKHLYIGTEHLLTALLSFKNESCEEILRLQQLNPAELAVQAGVILKSTGKFAEILSGFRESEKKMSADLDLLENAGPLEYFGKNLCSEACQNKIDPVIGRDQEISRVIEILSRRNKNNPLLLGDPGVGKTAIVEGLAKKIFLKQAPDSLLDKKIYAIDLAAVVAGTSYRGEFEARLKEIIAEASERPEVILFIDEIHQLIGAGSASGSMDAANILKPALARGEIKVIGATTYADYRKTIENDQALGRRFQTVKVAEPDERAAINILLNNKQFFERFHGVALADEAVTAAVELSQKYLPGKFLPDKAIDLIDEALAGEKIHRPKTPLEKDLKKLEQDAARLENELNRLLTTENFPAALELKTRLMTLDQKLSALKTRWQEEKCRLTSTVGKKHIAQVIERATGVPATEIILDDKRRALKLEAELNGEISGQKEAIKEIGYYLKRAKAGLAPASRPLASLLFVGPSGSGKTFTAKILAEKFFGNKAALIKIDMSEFSEKFQASKLIGAPAGYVGYKESGLLTEKIKHQPYSLVLLDEIEKANPEIFDLLLQVLDEGLLTDAAGAAIDFRNTIIVMTSNLGSEFYSGRSAIGFHSEDKSRQAKVIAAAQSWFRPEFISRLDKVICFNELGDKDLLRIAQRELTLLQQRLRQEQGWQLRFPENLAEQIIKQAKSADEKMDARRIKSLVSRQIESALIDRLLQAKTTDSKILRLKAKNGIISLS